MNINQSKTNNLGGAGKEIKLEGRKRKEVRQEDVEGQLLTSFYL